MDLSDPFLCSFIIVVALSLDFIYIHTVVEEWNHLQWFKLLSGTQLLVLFSYSFIDVINHIEDWHMLSRQSHCSHIRVLPILKLLVVLSLYSSSNSVIFLQDHIIQVLESLSLLEVLNNKCSVESSYTSTKYSYSCFLLLCDFC